ncbi:MAG: single-stranded DNA-binding protein [Pseudonocardiaceae bacterium]|nr:single-stranded DNA-binding protein [Pseudonocardiaceae bacterium]
MSNETTLTIVGNLTATPELRFAPSGIAVANMTVAATPRYYDKQAGQWADGDTLFLRVTAWRQLAENAAESLSRGDRVVVTGRLRQKSYQTAEGEKRTGLELHADELAPSLRYATVKVNKVTRDSGRDDEGDDGTPF